MEAIASAWVTIFAVVFFLGKLFLRLRSMAQTHGSFADPSIASASTVVSREGVLLTSPTVVARQGERLDLWSQTQADAVDMEAYWLARALQAHDQQLSCCRVISDDGREDLPDWVVRLLAAKTNMQTVQRVLQAVATQRQAARWMWKMNWESRRLSQRLADEVEDVLG